VTAREIQIFSGVLEQTVANESIVKTFQIKIPPRRAIQVYGTELSINGAYLYGQANNGSFIVNIFGENKSGTRTMQMHRWSKAIITIGAVVGVGVLDLNDSWLAPPSFIVALERLVIGLDSSNLTSDMIVEFSIFYKEIKISDAQEVQLALM